MTDAEVARNFASVLEKVQNGIEVVVERDAKPVAVISSPPEIGRPVVECIALAREYESRRGHAPVADIDFDKDVRVAVEAHDERLDSSEWD